MAATVPPAAGPLPATSTEAETRIRSERFPARMLTLPFREVRVAPSPTVALTSFPVTITSIVPPMAPDCESTPGPPRTPATVTASTSFFASALTRMSSPAVITQPLPTLALTLLLSSKPAIFTPTPAALEPLSAPPIIRLFTPLSASTVALPSSRVMTAPSPICALVTLSAKSMENAPAAAASEFNPTETAPAMDSI